MKILDFKFDFICIIDPLKENDKVKVYNPKLRYDNKKDTPLNKYGNGPFCKFKIQKNLKFEGVYAIVISSKLMYIGETDNFTKRFNSGYGNISPKNCYKGGQSTNCRINNFIYTAIRDRKNVELYFYKTEDYKNIELKILNNKTTIWNIKVK